MLRWTVLIFMVMAITALGCSSSSENPVTTNSNELTVNAQSSGDQTHLWGYYDIYVDIENQTVTAIENRSAMFAANVTQFVNSPPSNLGFSIKETIVTATHIDVDIDVSIKHPFTGLSQYNGYDVRGIFFGNASVGLAYNTDLDFGKSPADQIMLDDPDFAGADAAGGGPDGFTRWFNPKEFKTPGLLGYLPGVFATPGYLGNATLCPYKYFADGLGKNANLWDFLTTTTDDGVFSAGTTNTRNYYIRFPLSVGTKYGYAIVANWIDETTHPANAPEAVGLDAEVTESLYYVNPTTKGGDLILDISVFGWAAQPTKLFVESTVLSAPHGFDATEMTPTGGGANFSTYHCEIPADSIDGVDDNEFWVICEHDGLDYKNTMGVTNLAGNDKMAAVFRYDLAVSSEPTNAAPVVDSGVTGEDNPFITATETYTVTAHDDDGDPLTYSWDVSGGLLSGDPGNGDGTIDIDWGALGAVNDGNYDIDCSVSDGIAAPVAATTLPVTATSVVYLYDGSVDDGGMTTMNDVGIQWKYDSGTNVWDENGDVNTYDVNPVCTTLLTPAFDIPSGGTVKIDLVHSGSSSSWYSAYTSAGGMIGYTLDGGANVDYHNVTCAGSTVWLTLDSGLDFNCPTQYWTAFFGGWYNYSCMYCDEWAISWNNRIFGGTTWGSLGSPETTTWVASEIGGQNNVQLVFFWDQGSQFFGTESGSGWQLDKIKVYMAP